MTSQNKSHLLLKKQVLVTWNSCWTELWRLVLWTVLTWKSLSWLATKHLYLWWRFETVIDFTQKAAYKSSEFYARKTIKPLVDFIVVTLFLQLERKSAWNVFTTNWSTKTGSWLFLTWKTTSKLKNKCLLTTKTVTHGWIKSSLTLPKAGFFSSDRTIAQYNEYLALELRYKIYTNTFCKSEFRLKFAFLNVMGEDCWCQRILIC